MPIEDDEIGGYRIAAGMTMFLSGFLTHRHPDFWDNPEGLEPERDTAETMKARGQDGGPDVADRRRATKWIYAGIVCDWTAPNITG